MFTIIVIVPSLPLLGMENVSAMVSVQYINTKVVNFTNTPTGKYFLGIYVETK